MKSCHVNLAIPSGSECVAINNDFFENEVDSILILLSYSIILTMLCAYAYFTPSSNKLMRTILILTRAHIHLPKQIDEKSLKQRH